MNPEITVLFFLFVALIGCLSIFYDNVVRPVRRDEVRYRLFELRDLLRWKGITGEVDPKSPYYFGLEEQLCNYIDLSHLFTWQSFLLCLIVRTPDPAGAAFQDFEKNAPKALTELHNKAMHALLPALRANSPVIHKILELAVGFMSHKERIVRLFRRLRENEDGNNHSHNHGGAIRA